VVDRNIQADARVGFALVSLAARHGAGVAQVLGLTLPPPGRWVKSGDLTAICTTPGQWLVMQDADDFTLFDRISEAVEDTAAVIELSDSRVSVRVSGEGARTALGTLLPLDLHPRAMQPGHAAATLAAHLPMLVRQIDATPTYEIMCGRSFAESFYRALQLAGIPV
jgi:sarcosine oxidase subunit gamma